MPSYDFLVQVQPEYLPEQSDPSAGQYAFAYTITITNRSAVPAQLIARHWLVSDARGHTEEVRGLGLVGQQPLLAPGETFRYTSGCRLHTASGTMHGSYLGVSDQGEVFAVPIPLFVLEASMDDGPLRERVLH